MISVLNRAGPAGGGCGFCGVMMRISAIRCLMSLSPQCATVVTKCGGIWLQRHLSIQDSPNVSFGFECSYRQIALETLPDPSVAVITACPLPTWKCLMGSGPTWLIRCTPD